MSQSVTTTGIAAHIAVIDGQPTTTTQDIAEVYGKRHDDVLRIIRQRMAQCPEEWCLRNFAETETERPSPLNGAPIKSPVIRMTKKGFHFVVGKFTGAKAVAHQIAFADEFERMEAQIVGLHNSATAASQKQVDSKPLQLAAPALPSKAQIADALGLSLSIAGWVQQLVAKAVLAEDEGWRNQRWLLSFKPASKQGTPPVVELLPPDARMVRPADVGQMLLQGGAGAVFTADEVANIAWHATWRMHSEAADRKDSGHLETLRKQVRALPAHELADIATEAYLNLAVANPTPKHLANKGADHA